MQNLYLFLQLNNYEIAINNTFAQAIENASPVRKLGSSNTDENYAIVR
jgi:hypothetical protein